MKTLYRLTLIVAVVSLILVSGSLACTRLTGLLSFDAVEFFALCRQIEEGQRRAAELDRESRAVFERLEAKFHIIEDLRCHRASLLEAADRFRALQPFVSNGQEQMWRRIFTGLTDEERWCRHVIQFAEFGGKTTAENMPLAEELKEELNAYLVCPAARFFTP
jgi:hypothetical protein